jgi:hypothetical protein
MKLRGQFAFAAKRDSGLSCRGFVQRVITFSKETAGTASMHTGVRNMKTL